MPSESDRYRRASTRTQAKSALLRFLDEKRIDPDFVGAIAGDREMSSREKAALEELERRRGPRMYSDLLFAITQQYFPVEQSKDLWDRIMKHKYEMSERLGRNVKITVAALDYLSNMTTLLPQPMLISTPKMAVVAEVALKDGMTQLYDHSTFLDKLRNEVHRYNRYGNRISLIMLDIDRFKEYNDTRGHVEGDRLLTRLGKMIREEIRDVDVAARYGGEEFAIMLPRTTEEEALQIAERIRKRTERDFDGLTISLGVACCPDNARDAKSLIEAADKALYTSKREGRNRTTCQDEPFEEP